MVDMIEEVEPAMAKKSRKEGLEDTDGEILLKTRSTRIWELKKLLNLLKLPQKLQLKVPKPPQPLKKPRLKLSHKKRRKKKSTT